ncbi:MAG TPA: DUF1304 family protein [Hymenobacter sp.]
MQLLSQVLIGLVAAIHLYILWLEMFAWTTRGPKTFRSLRPERSSPPRCWPLTRGCTTAFWRRGWCGPC